MTFSDCIALVALGLSVFALYKQINSEKISQNTIFFEEIFFKFLTRDCVDARNNLTFDSNGRIVNTEYFEEILADLAKNISFLEYVDKKFYQNLKRLLTSLDELLVDEKRYRGKNQTDHSNKIDEKIAELLKLIMDKYFIK